MSNPLDPRPFGPPSPLDRMDPFGPYGPLADPLDPATIAARRRQLDEDAFLADSARRQQEEEDNEEEDYQEEEEDEAAYEEEEDDPYWYTREGQEEFIERLAKLWEEEAGEYLDRDKYDHEYVPIWNADLVRKYEQEGWINLGPKPGDDDYYRVVRRKT
jgi:hypothetical protein